MLHNVVIGHSTIHNTSHADHKKSCMVSISMRAHGSDPIVMVLYLGALWAAGAPLKSTLKRFQ